jgi:2-oxoglutarate dehydrogenase E2 component (dihydrolipoamide succinyltransferase)
MAVVPVVMPKLGESIVEGTITRWLVKEGDAIKKDQPIVTVATDKADTDVPSPASGIVRRLLAAEGEVIAVEKPIAELDTDATAKPAPAPASAAAPVTAAVDGPPTTPRVRNLARELGVDVSTVQGSGERGRVTPKDVEAAAQSRATAAVVSQPAAAVAAPTPAPVAAPTRAEAAAVVASSAAATTASLAGPRAFQVKPYVPAPGDEVVKFNRRRRIIADHMVYSKLTSPHVYTFAEIDMHRVARMRDAKKDAYKAEGVGLTFLAFIAAATARALRENPLLNARVLDDAYVKLREVNLGVAVETPAGLIVPVVRNADDLTVKGLARGIDGLARKARDGSITPDELSGASFTISNPGLKGNFVGAAVISQPNVGILRTGEIVKRPVVVEVDGVDTIAIHPVMFVCLSYDHRIVDGVAANNFLHRITELLETGQFDL